MNPIYSQKRTHQGVSEISNGPKRIKRTVSLALDRVISPVKTLKTSISCPELENSPPQELECRKLLASMKREIVEPSIAMPALDRFVERALRKTGASYRDLEEELKGSDEGPLWNRVREAVDKGHRAVQGLIVQDRLPTFVTGSGSASLIGIDETARTALAQFQHALVPSGMLLNAKIVPLTGELKYGIGEKGVNLEHLSGVILDRIETAVHYSRGYLRFDLGETKKAIQTENHPQHLLVHLLRFIKCGGRADPEWELMKEELLKRSGLERIRTILQETVDLTEDEEELLHDPFPLIWGAHYNPDHFVPLLSGIKGERAVKGVLPLGDPNGVTCVFTKKIHLPRIRDWLTGRSLNVVPLSIGALYYCSLREKILSHTEF